MERIVHAFILFTSIVWPLSFIAATVVIPPVGLIATAAILTLTLFSIRFFKNLFRQALDAYFSDQA
jgi:hypothetical protein